MDILRILAFALIVAGFGSVYIARNLVNKFNLDQNIKCEFENEMDEEELKNYKFNKAVLNVKMLGMLVGLPGMILLLFVFR